LATAKLSSKNQITIPKRITNQLGLVSGDRLSLEVRKDEIVLKAPSRVKRPTELLYNSVNKKVDVLQVIRSFRKTGGRA